VDDSVFSEALLPIALAIIMVSLGLALTPADFRRVLVFPKGVAIGIGNLLVISPLLAFGVAELTGLSPELAVGLVLLGASPGGTTANMLTHLARGDTALSVTMTAISSLAAVVTVPFYLNLSIDVFDAGDVAGDLSMAGIRLAGDGVLVDGDRGAVQRLLGHLCPSRPCCAVDQHQVVVRAAGDQGEAALHEPSASARAFSITRPL
jgi:hypothetical protein